MSTRGRRAEAWTRAALAPPRAHGAPLASAEMKAEPEDFRVEEQLSFVPSGDGPHWLLRIEKRAANTRWVAAELARLARQTPSREVGYAGLKDRHARQRRSGSACRRARTPRISGAPCAPMSSGCSTCMRMRASSSAARLAGNRFRIRLRKVVLVARVARDEARRASHAWACRTTSGRSASAATVSTSIASPHGCRAVCRPPGRGERGFALSAARSLALQCRARAPGGERAIGRGSQPGDLASLDGSGSHFRGNGRR